MAAEAEAVFQDAAELPLAGFVGHVIQIALGIGVVQIDRGRHDLVLEGERARHKLHAARCSEQMTELALRAGDDEILRMGPEHVFDRGGFSDIA